MPDELVTKQVLCSPNRTDKGQERNEGCICSAYKKLGWGDGRALLEKLGKGEKVCDWRGRRKAKVSFRMWNSFSGFPENIGPKVGSSKRRRGHWLLFV